MTESPISLYVHIPFCQHRCAYCDFNTYAGLENLIPEYVSALQNEIEFIATAADHLLPVHTIFLGGGTPSLLSIKQVGLLMDTIRRNYDLLPGIEISIEANPGTTSIEYLQGLKQLGINRLSFGVQSVIQNELQMLERQHDFFDVIQAYYNARRSGFSNINLDLIFGLPNQKMEDWHKTLRAVLKLSPDHLSLYSLTLEHGTPMLQWTKRGLLSEPDPDLAAEMYEYASETLTDAGYFQYEISNWARLDGQGNLLSCQHNLQYWRTLPYLGFGAGAHGYIAGIRIANILSPISFIKRIQSGNLREFPRSPATISIKKIDKKTEMGEVLMMGLRLTEEGISARNFYDRFEEKLEDVFPQQIQSLLNFNLLEWENDDSRRLRLTSQGRLLGNQVFKEFI